MDSPPRPFSPTEDWQVLEQHQVPVLEGDGGNGNFVFSFRHKNWMPSVRYQGHSTFCWAFSTAQVVGAVHSFHVDEVSPQLSPQCLINGVPSHVPDDELIWYRMGGHSNNPRYVYETSTYVALRFIIERGIASESRYPYVRYCQPDRPFEPAAQVSGPFKVPEEMWTANRLTGILREYGCLLGTFRCDNTLENYRASEIYSLPEDVAERSSGHCAMIVGAGRIQGQDFFEIQNSWGSTWGDSGYGRVSPDLFDSIDGIRHVVFL